MRSGLSNAFSRGYLILAIPEEIEKSGYGESSQVCNPGEPSLVCKPGKPSQVCKIVLLSLSETPGSVGDAASSPHQMLGRKRKDPAADSHR